ncbi:MAG TPA: polysaccharide biosynthesis tyrosine autokinase [Solimonas sp.]
MTTLQKASQGSVSQIDDGGEIDFRELLGVLVAGRLLLAAIAVVVLLAGVFHAWTATRIYSVDALIQVETERSGIASALGDASQMLGADTKVAAEIEILRSRMVLGKVVDELDLVLDATPAYFPYVGRAFARGFRPTADRPIAREMPGLSRFAWGGESIRMTDFVIPDVYIGRTFHLRAQQNGAYDLFESDGRPIVSGKVGERIIFELGGQPSALFVQSLTARPGTEFDLRYRRRAEVIRSLESRLQVSEQGRQSGILRLSFSDPNPVRAAQILNKIAEVYLRQNVERKSAEAQQTLAFLNEQLPKLRKNVEEAESAINSYRLRQGSADLTKETDLILQQAVTLEQSRMQLEQRKEEALRRFTSNHPVVEAINGQLSQIAREKAGIEAKVKDLPETQQELLRLSRDMEVNSTLYLSLLNSTQELEVVKAGTVGNVRIIDAAVPPSTPAKPRVSVVLGISLLLGLALGMLAVFARSALHAGVEDPAEVEKKLGIATYSVIPYSEGQRRIHRLLKKDAAGNERLLAQVDPNGNAIEALRSLRTSLHFGQLEAKNNILMLTGPSPGLGKSFVSANLGAVLAASGKKIVVVDGDLRRGHLHEYFNVQRTPGVTDYIAGSAAVADVIHRTTVDGLHFVSTGTVPPNPAELLLSEAVGELLTFLSQRYDTVILDTPPVLAVTDAAVLGQYAGTTLLVLKAGEHSLRMIEDSLKRLQAAGIPVRGTVFNQVGIGGRGRYSHKYGYNYGYYNYNYQPKVKKTPGV